MRITILARNGLFAALAAALLMLGGCSGEDRGDAGTSAEAGGGKLTLNWFITAPPNTNLPDRSKDFVRKVIEQKFNVELNVTYMIVNNDYNTKLNALLASTPPDMWKDQNSDGGNKYAVDGLLADLTDFVTPQTMPNYFKYWTTEDEVRTYQTQNKFVRAPLPYVKSSYRAYYIRKDWLDKLGLSVPASYDEYVNVMRAFTFSDPDGNGKQDTYGFSTSGSGMTIGYDWPEFYKAGFLFPSYIENGSVVDGSMTPGMRYMLDDITRLMYVDKVIDPDWYLNKGPQHLEKAIQGKIGVVMGGTKTFAFDSNAQGIQYRSKQVNPNADWLPFSMFPNVPLGAKSGPGSPFLFAKSVAERNPEKVRRSVEILDWLCSEEGYLLTHYGEAGKHYTREGKTLRLNVDAFVGDVAKQGDFLKIWSFFTQDTPQPELYGLTVYDPRVTERDLAIEKFLASLPLKDYIGTSLTPPDGFDLAGYRKRQNELFAKAIFEDKSGRNWPQYREELLTKYKGAVLFEKYNQDLRDAGILR